MGADLEFGAAPAAPSLSFGAEAQAAEAPAAQAEQAAS